MAAPAAKAETVKLSGSATVINAVVTPNRDKIEKSSGATLQIASNTTGRGLVDQAERSADLALLAGPLELWPWPPPNCRPQDRALDAAGARPARR